MSAPRREIRVLVAGGSLLERARLESLVAQGGGLKLAGSAGDWSSASRLAGQLLPDVLLLFVAPSESLARAEALLDGGAGCALVALLEEEPRPAGLAPGERLGWAGRGALRALLPSDASSAEIRAAVVAAAAGLLVVHPSLAAAPVEGHAAPPMPAGRLTSREEEVLRMIAEGLANKTIAAELGITSHTVKFHVTSIMQKLGAASRTEAVTKGLRRGLLLL